MIATSNNHRHLFPKLISYIAGISYHTYYFAFYWGIDWCFHTKYMSSTTNNENQRILHCSIARIFGGTFITVYLTLLIVITIILIRKKSQPLTILISYGLLYFSYHLLSLISFMMHP